MVRLVSVENEEQLQSDSIMGDDISDSKTDAPDSSQEIVFSSAVEETPLQSLNGYPIAITALAVVGLAIYSFINLPASLAFLPVFARAMLLLAGLFLLKGLYMLHPNQAALLVLFGAYRGTDRCNGLRWCNPLCRVRKISLRAHSFISDEIKVNDKSGNPIEIAAAVVWRVNDTARASFNVENYEDYVHVQSEAAIRFIASAFAYDSADDDQNDAPEVTLRSGVHQINAALIRALQDRFDEAGLLVEDAKLTHLAYAPEIASVMLRRQQAEAIIAARQKIVSGAVSMVEMALQALTEYDLVQLDDERKASMVSNLMVVLCAETDVKPVVNVGTLYS